MDDDEGLDCPICLDTYNEDSRTPKMMSCLHSVCASCIIDLALPGLPRSRGNIYGELNGEPAIPIGKTFCCPLCREEILTDRIQTNRYILAHLRDLKKLTVNNKKPLTRTIKAPLETTQPFPEPLKSPDSPPPPPPPISTIPTLRAKEKSKDTPKSFLGLSTRIETTSTFGNGVLFQKSKKSTTPSIDKSKTLRKHPAPPKSPPPPPPMQRKTTPPVQRTGTQYIPVPHKPPAPLPKPEVLPRKPIPPSHSVVFRRHPYSPQTPVFQHPAQTQEFPRHPFIHPPPSYNPYYTGNSPAFVQSMDDFSHNEATHFPISQVQQSPGQTTPTAPVAGQYLVIPKPPPATTLHQKNPNRGLSNLGPRYPNLYPSIGECLTSPASPSAPPQLPPLPNPQEMWCRSCEEQGKVTCAGHDLIPLLKAQEVDWIIELQKKIERKLEQEKSDQEIARALAENYLVVPSSTSTQNTPDVLHSDEVDKAENSRVFDLSKNTYQEIRDVVNTSCDPDLLMACVKEFDRRHIEYRRTIRRKTKNRAPLPTLYKT